MEPSRDIYTPRLDKGKCNECGLCLEVCPGHAVDFRQLNLDIFGKEAEDIWLGNYLNCYIGHATDYEIRYNSASGGLVTALLIFALEEGVIDGALVTKMSDENPLRPWTFIARTREEIIAASKSKYCPVPANTILKEIVRADGRLAVVGLPCHIQGMRKAEVANEGLRHKIVLHFGLFCGHTPSLLATEYLLYKLKARKEEIKRLDYRGEGWPGKVKASLGDRQVESPYLSQWSSGFGSFFTPQRCTLCVDVTSELADISFGDAWLPELKDDKVGTSIVVSRSEKTEIFLQKAIAAKEVELHHISRDEVVRSQLGHLTSRKTRKGNGFHWRLLGYKAAPVYKLSLPPSTFRSYPMCILTTIRRRLGAKKTLWKLIPLYSCLESGLISLLRPLYKLLKRQAYR